jgi:hypothetical protein
MYAGHNIVVAIDKKYEHPNQRILLAVDKYDKPSQARGLRPMAPCQTLFYGTRTGVREGREKVANRMTRCGAFFRWQFT